MRDSLVALSLEERLTNGFNPNELKSNYHGADYSSNGIDYSAAIDIIFPMSYRKSNPLLTG